MLPSPSLLASQDAAAFNAGILLLPLAMSSLELLNQTIITYHTIRNQGNLHPHCSDQIALQTTLRQDAEFGDRFYEIPHRWLNDYAWYPDDKDAVRLHWHLVAGVKYDFDWSGAVEQAEDIWAIMDGHDVQSREMRGRGIARVEKEAREWWQDSEAKRGIWRLPVATI
jgi:hypothetical protein